MTYCLLVCGSLDAMMILFCILSDLRDDNGIEATEEEVVLALAKVLGVEDPHDLPVWQRFVEACAERFPQGTPQGVIDGNALSGAVAEQIKAIRAIMGLPEPAADESPLGLVSRVAGAIINSFAPIGEQGFQI